MSTTLERVLSRFPRNSFGDSGIDHLSTRQATVNTDYSFSLYDFRITADNKLPPPKDFDDKDEWDVYENDIPKY